MWIKYLSSRECPVWFNLIIAILNCCLLYRYDPKSLTTIFIAVVICVNLSECVYKYHKEEEDKDV